VGTDQTLRSRVGTTSLVAWKVAAQREGVRLSEWIRKTLDHASVEAQQTTVDDWSREFAAAKEVGTAYERICAARKQSKPQS